MKRIWIYQANRFFTAPEREQALQILQEFVQDWTAHGNKLAGTADIVHNLFIVLQVDESMANVTGCSIDKSVHLLKRIEHELNISLFDRLLVAYRDKDGGVQLVSRDVFQALVTEGVVTDDTPVFNNLITDGEDFPNNWEVSFAQCWHAQVFKK